MMENKGHIVISANVSWYLYNFRLPLLLKIKSNFINILFYILDTNRGEDILTRYKYNVYNDICIL